jgi:hypothetical protein
MRDEVVSEVNPDFAKERNAWHRLILTDPVSLVEDPLKVSEKFAKPFGLPPHPGYAPAVRKMATLKQVRNDFAHRGDEVYFDEFYRDVLYVAVQIYFANLPGEKQTEAVSV